MLSMPTALTNPLHMDADGVLRIGATRVTLDSVIFAFRRGSTAENIAEQFPALRLSEVYTVIAYALEHREIVDQYLSEQRDKANTLREQVEQDFPTDGLRARLLAKRAAKQS